MSPRLARPSIASARSFDFVDRRAAVRPFASHRVPVAELTLSPAERAGSGIRAMSGLRAVLFDAGNTLVFLDYTRLAEEVGTALQLPLTGEGLRRHEAAATRAMEQAAATDQARAAAYLEALFLHGGVPRNRLGEVRDCLGRMHRRLHLWCSVPEGSARSLERLRDAGLRLGIVSNSDGRVEEALEAAGLRHYFDVVIDSGHVGVEKPDPRIFYAALDALGVAPSEALYVGDLYEVDVVGANAAGIEAVLVATSGDHTRRDCRTTPSIEALVNDILPAIAERSGHAVKETE